MMKIDNDQLAAFAAVLQEGSFEAAARRLHVTPSAISQRMRQLEERLGQVLLQRGSPCQPTAAGRTLARYTEQLALLEAETLAELGDVDGNGLRDTGGVPLRVPLAVNADSLDSWFPASFDALPAEPAMVFDLRVEDQDHSATLLREGVVMAAVSASAEPVQGCTVEPLGIMRYLAVASPQLIAQAFAKGVNASSLSRTPMLAFNRKDALQARFIALLIGPDAADSLRALDRRLRRVCPARARLGHDARALRARAAGARDARRIRAAPASGRALVLAPMAAALAGARRRHARGAAGGGSVVAAVAAVAGG